MSSRERIFATLYEAVAEPVAMTHTRPRLDDDLIALFEHNAQATAATLDHVADEAGLPDALANYLASTNQTDVGIAVAPGIADLFPALHSAPIQPDATHPGAEVSVTGCIAAVAETGSVLMASGPTHPTTLNFLPETHVVIIRTNQVVAHLEDAWVMIETMPRALNLITGPSRTADIEQTLQLGAHGPRRLHAIVVAG
ncbi:MAG: lactate utilization protein [Gammaproteobacteria bacterium]|nr:lactate utilization protein [Gammaproteobacteria bacterium]MCP5136291.1 lactate utilization protein [Gammaproteobacteria bacterium]